MAAAVAHEPVHNDHDIMQQSVNGHDDPFTTSTGNDTPSRQQHIHRYSSRFDFDSASPGATSSPSQVRRVLEAHLLETERRLEETQKLGTTLLDQQARLQDKLRDVERQQDEAEITPQLKQQLLSIAQEHDETGKDLARKLLAPKSRAVSNEGEPGIESGTYTSHASGSPTKISAPNRRSRNLPTTRVGDLQFAADISTSLLAQVRQLQAAVAERDEVIKTATTGRLQLEQEVQEHTQRIRDLQEHEQRYKDENWNLETQNHELLATTRDASEKERRLNTSLAAMLAEKSRLQSEFEEVRLAHGQLGEEHTAARKAHETEMHSLKRNVDVIDSERTALQNKVEELTAQNQELARAMAGKYRNASPNIIPDMDDEAEDASRDLGTPEHSPPPSPTKATPRHGGLESETLRSSLHHAHRMIQNLKGNIHREKTEKIELKRMLQDARDELEQRRTDNGVGNGAKRTKTRSETFKKPLRPDQLGGTRRARTDVELEDENWEDHANEDLSSIPRHLAPNERSRDGFTDMSDAYQTANETEGAFETADERHNTESEAFETGAESLAGDSTDDLTETEDTVSGAPHTTARVTRKSLPLKQAGNRNSYLSTASTSADDDDEELQTPIQAQPHKFRLRNGRSSYSRHSSTLYEGTPGSARSSNTAQDSPATLMEGQSPPVPEQSLFAELGGLDDASSDRYSTPSRSSIVARDITPHHLSMSSPAASRATPILQIPKPRMVDSAMMTEPWMPEPSAHVAVTSLLPENVAAGANTLSSPEMSQHPRASSPSDFPLPPSVPASPLRNNDMSTQYTPQRSLLESPLRNNTFITPPKTIWDEASEAGSPMRDVTSNTMSRTPKTPLGRSGVLTQAISPHSPSVPVLSPAAPLAYSGILSQQIQPISPHLNKDLVSSTSIAPATPTSSDRSKHVGEMATGVAAGGALTAAALASGSNSKNEQASATKENVVKGTDVLSGKLYPKPQQYAPGTNGLSILPLSDNAGLSKFTSPTYSSNDQKVQTVLTAEQIERALRSKAAPAITPIVVPTTVQNPPNVRGMSSSTSKFHEALETMPGSYPKTQNLEPSADIVPAIAGPSSSRSPSASSHRTSSLTMQQHPPLPHDYKTNIAKANNSTGLPTLDKKSSVPGTATIMGPPAIPASAMRRPRTPAESFRSPTRDNATPRASHSRGHRGTTSSQLSHRSSVSSFASELDERFNIRANGVPSAGPAFEAGPGTDPRMIQAITQTMIGEYLWKYTRNTFSKDFSSSRHRRYFWVHPYTKTLYWSTNGPESGQKEQTSRSVVIESVRVINDDNPMPPGLHRKSLEVTTPGRKIRFTASTGQRHETWFNALSYLLLRGDSDKEQGVHSTGVNEITRDDIDEFNAGGYNAHLVPRTNSRMSMSSYNSRNTRGTSTHRASRQPMPSNVITNTITNQSGQRALAVRDNGVSKNADRERDSDRDDTIRARSSSRISRMIGSVTGRPSTDRPQSSQQAAYQHDHNRPESQNSIYNTSAVSGSRRSSAEEMRQEMLRQEAIGLGHGTGNKAGLENVRACCDGKHDVSTLTHDISTLAHPAQQQHHHHQHNTDKKRSESSVTDRINRSVSRRM